MQRRYVFTRLAFFLAFACLLGCGSRPSAQPVPASPLPSPTGYVNDYANVIDPQTQQRMETMLRNLDQRHQIEFSVVAVPTTGGQDIFDYSLAVMRGWGIGSKEKPGLLLLVAIQDRKYFTQVSRHLEGDMPDSLAGQITRNNLVEPFRAGRYGEGLMVTSKAYVEALAQKRGFSAEGLDPGVGYQPRQPRRQAPRPQQGSLSVCGIGVIILIILFFMMAGRGRGGGGGSGCLSMLLFNALLNSGSSRSSGWGGGGGWGGGSGGGGWGDGGFGGFSGGGGDAGGGGAGGDW